MHIGHLNFSFGDREFDPAHDVFGAEQWVERRRLEGEDQRRLAVFLVDGFSVDAGNMTHVGCAINKALRIDILARALPGHTGGDDFYSMSAGDYYDLVESDFLDYWEELNPVDYRRTRILVGGFSTGALIASIIAARHPDKVAGLALFGTALALAKGFEKALSLLRTLGKRRVWHHWFINREDELASLNGSNAAVQPRYTNFPLDLVLSLKTLQEQARRSLEKSVRGLPAFLAHSTLDPIADFQALRTVARSMRQQHELVQFLEIESNVHNVLQTPAKELVINSLIQWISTTLLFSHKQGYIH